MKIVPLRQLWLICGWLAVLFVLFGSLYPLPEPPIQGGDKLHHFIAYGFLYWWFAQATPASKKSALTLIFLLVSMGIAIEFLQPYANRVFDTADMLANTTGVIVAWILVTLGINIPIKFREKIRQVHPSP